MTVTRRRSERGHVAVELSLATALLLVPVLLLVVSLPRWVERRHAATLVATEAARVAARRYPDDGRQEAVDRAIEVARVYGVPADDVQVDVVGDLRRGGTVVASVRIRMPVVDVPGLGRAASWWYTTSYQVRIDDYRSR